ncbi:P-loop containing nucleoside triphosphate hydrolase protein [Mycena rebaudengoi]|nr:P-loop containing nucleoside triphosphate hydrolase protein [Mycena rebaudengoi]
MPPPQPQTPRRHFPSPAARSPGTPRRRSTKNATRLQGTSPAKMTIAQISARLITLLALTFIPELWQLHIISRFLRGFDCIFLAGTGYGKSLIFEGLAVLGGKKKIVIVICPLKALERDQVEQARAKGINAVLINEDNTKSAAAWKEARTKAQLVYISPEMACSATFNKLWTDQIFRKRITAVIVDEAHCIHEWGDEFRPEYKLLEELRNYTGQEVPIGACTATAATPTFDTIWNSLAFGNRPFWGIDVGCDRHNLVYLTRTISNPKNPVLDVLNLLPDKLDENTPREAVDKMLFYFDSEAACTNGVDTVRMALPEHLRDCVYTFSAGISEDAKKDCWEGFMSGRYRIICCTDAAGMGCNVPDVKITVIFGCSKSLAVVCQRWGRTGRGRETLGTCIFLVPVWAFRPAPVETGLGLAVQTLRGQPKHKIEPKTHTASRGRIERNLEAFINSASAGTFEGCLTTYPSLEATTPTFVGELSQNSAYELTWISMDLSGKSPPRGRCCGPCNPTLLASFRPSTSQDHRLRQFARDFLNPITQVDEPDRPISPSSSASGDSESETVRFEPMAKGQTVSKAEKDSLKARLVAWRVLRHKKRGSSKFLSPAIALPDRQLETLVSSCGKFLTESVIEKKQILAVVKNWDFGTDEDFCDVAEIIRDWRKLFVSTTPKSQHRSKRSRTDNASAIPVPPQPNFTPLRRAVNPTTPSRNALFQERSRVLHSFPRSSLLPLHTQHPITQHRNLRPERHCHPDHFNIPLITTLLFTRPHPLHPHPLFF